MTKEEQNQYNAERFFNKKDEANFYCDEEFDFVIAQQVAEDLVYREETIEQ